MDLVYIVIVVGFFVLTWGFVRLCGVLGGAQ